jgi:hypothetical protein
VSVDECEQVQAFSSAQGNELSADSEAKFPLPAHQKEKASIWEVFSL